MSRSSRAAPDGVSSSDLEEIMAQCSAPGYFRGIFRKDRLPPMDPSESSCMIINLENTGAGNGTHWVAYGVTALTPWYFDSFGLGVPEEIKRHAKREIVYCQNQVQDMRSTLCGLFAVAACLATEHSRVPKRALQKLVRALAKSPDLAENDAKVTVYIRERMRRYVASDSDGDGDDADDESSSEAP